VLVVGGHDPAGSPLASRLAAAGHRLALQGGAADLPGDPIGASDHIGPGRPGPVLLPADRTDADAMTAVVTAAAQVLGGLDAVVILPAARPAGPPITIDPGAWADAWSHLLAADVLATACVTHAAAQLFRTDSPTAGRIVLVTGVSGSDQPGGLPAVAADAAIAALGAELARDLAAQGVAVTVVSARPGMATDRFDAEVAETVTMLLAAPALPGMTVRLGS
jgi:NAD(P)-dependent dehydrogenase (short-subunit alcohol dehydrogenase family)